MEMRTGKTKTVLDEFGQDEIDGVVQQLLVIAPGGVYRTWETDAEKHLGRSAAGANADRHLGVRPARCAEGSKTSWPIDGPRILLVNVEALSIRATSRAMLCLDFLKQAPTTMVIDESTTIKNPEGDSAPSSVSRWAGSPPSGASCPGCRRRNRRSTSMRSSISSARGCSASRSIASFKNATPS